MSNVYLGYETAFIYWRYAKDGAATLCANQKEHQLKRCASNATEALSSLAGTMFLHPESPFKQSAHVLSDNPNSKNAGQVVFHRPHKKDHLSFVALAKGIYISTPELSFIQAAQTLSFEKTIEYGYALCGTYALCDESEWGSVEREPLTSPKKLSDYLQCCVGVKGVKQALRALRYVQEKSASPRETQAAMVLTLPRKYGGAGLEPASLNARIDIPLRHSSATHRNYFVADLFWKEGRVVLEYDSDVKHANSQGIAEDSVKRNTLITMGYTPFGLTRLQLNNPSATQQAAEAIRLALHAKSDKRLPRDYPLRVARLRREIGLPSRWREFDF